jgi:signal transduction histidine kinase
MQGWRRPLTGPVRTGAVLAWAAALSGCTGEAGPWWFGSLALVLVGAGGAGIGWLLARQADRSALHDSRQQARLLQTLLTDLTASPPWRTDAQGRLRPDNQLLTERFDAGERAQRLQAQLCTPEVLDATLATAPGGAGLVELRAAPCFDGQGRFDGHLGVARVVAHDDVASAALCTLADTQAAPLLVLVRWAADPRWRVLQANASARQRFGEAPLLDTAAVAAALPTGLRGPFAAGAAAAETEGWQLRHRVVAEQTLCLLWQVAGAADGEQASLTYTVSHDLRAPIRVVEGFTRIVKEDYGRVLDRVANDHLDRVLGAAARMNQMIDAMLTLARLSTQPLARQPVNLTQLAGYVVDDLRRASPEREALIQIEPGLQTEGDPTLLRLVLENLLGNAWKYSARRPQTRIEFGRETVDNRVVYVVRDNGAGFDMRSAERLFGLFQRLHSANDFAGTGVGLASVRRIIQRHGGEIWADGEPGRGAAFFFTLRA